MDKNNFKKHHFWILLALAVVLIPVVLGGAVFGVGKAAGEKRAAVDKKLKDLIAASPKSAQYLEELEKQKAELEKQRQRVWQLAYQAQDGMIQFPKAKALEKNDTKYFGDPIDESDRADFRNQEIYLAEYDKLPEIIAPTQFAGGHWAYVLRTMWEWQRLPSVEDVWLAVEDLSVQREILKDIRAVNQMFAGFLPEPNPNDEKYRLAPDFDEKTKERLKTSVPQDASPEDAAKALQALLKEEREKKEKELQGLLKAEQDKVTKELQTIFQPKEGEALGRFISPYWQLDLALARSPNRAGEVIIRYKLKNVSPRRQNVYKVEFKIYLSDPSQGANVEPVLLPVQADYLASGAYYPSDAPFATEARIGGSRGSQFKVYKVEQKLDVQGGLRFAPVKRVDRLALSYTSHRFANRTLVPSAFSEKEIASAAAAAPVGEPGVPGVPGEPGSPDSGRGPPGSGQVNYTHYTPNGMPRMRYLDRTDQVRRMPIGLTLIVDQNHVQDVLRAFANSRLRFQGTQFHWQRFYGVISMNELGSGEVGPPIPGGRPGEDASPPGPGGRRMGPAGSPDSGRFGPSGSPDGGRPPFGGRGGRFPGGFGGVPTPGGPQGGRFGPSPGGMPVGPGGVVDPNAPPVEDGSANLVELSIYGLISLYERFPPKPTTEGAPPADGAALPAGTPPALPPALPPVPPGS